METIKVDTQNLQPLHEEWHDTFENLKGSIDKLPSVLSEAVNPNKALMWLDAASKLYPENIVKQLIHQVSGLGAKDIRTLIANERNEYYPEDSILELYNRKLLNNIVAPNAPKIEKERILTNITRSMLSHRYQLERNILMERSMSLTDSTRHAEWLVGNPGMVATKGDDNFIYDINFNDNTDEINQGDLIRLHYYDLVANNVGQQLKHLNLVKVSVNPEFADALVALSRVSKDAEKTITQMAQEFQNLPEDKIKIQVHQIAKNPELYKEIISVGQKHWQNILSGEIPEIKEDPPLQLEGERKALYIDKAKSFLSATQTVKAAEKARQDSIDEFIKSMSGFDITDNFQPPYMGALLRKYDYFDAEGAAKYFESNLGIDPVHLREQVINVDMLTKSYQNMGGDLTPFYEYTTPNKKSIETVAEQLEFDLTGFYTREMRAIVNPKTRGPIYDAIKDIRQEALENVTKINLAISQSSIMDNRNLLNSESATLLNQKTMKL